MSGINNWFERIHHWYGESKDAQIDQLITIIKDTPSDIFSPPITHTHCDAIAYFVDGCIKLQRHYESLGRANDAYLYLQFCYAKLQVLASNSDVDKELKRWSMKKLDQLIICMLEFCQYQNNDVWRRESKQLIELHVLFMHAQNDINLQYSHRPTKTDESTSDS